jgi:hypothetical protein
LAISVCRAVDAGRIDAFLAGGIDGDLAGALPSARS